MPSFSTFKGRLANRRCSSDATIYASENGRILLSQDELADIADRFTRNEILTSNEFRAIIGYKPVETERANELINKNISQSKLDLRGRTQEQQEEIQNGSEV